MTLPLLPVEPTPARRVRCANPLCGRWLRDPESIARRFGRDCAEELGLIPPRRHRVSVASGAADMTLMDLIIEEKSKLRLVRGGIGWCIACHAAGNYVVAVDEVSGDACKAHLVIDGRAS